MKQFDFPLVSIIMPAYNAEEYLEIAIKSVIDQTYKNWELIIVDDCSTDSTSDICDEWKKKDSRIKVVHHDKNLKAGQSRTNGIFVARGSYIGFLDSDDYMHPQMIETMLKTAIKENSLIVMCEYIHNTDDMLELYGIQEENNSITLEQLELSEIVKRMYYPGLKAAPYYMVCNKLFASSIAKQIKTNIPGGEDLFFCYNAYFIAERMVHIIGKPLYYYRIRNGSLENSGFIYSQVSQLRVHLQIENDIYTNNSNIFTGNIAKKIYKMVLSSRYNSRKTRYKKEVNDIIKSYFKNFRMHFWQCKDIRIINKLLMDIMYYFPFVYSLFRKIDENRKLNEV